MGLRINSNIAALSSYNNLNKTDKAVSSSLEKLSSGFRINKAADDAAGLVVSEGLKSQIGGLTVAARNAQDGVNVAQTADGALGTATDILQRMRDLAVQASNSGSQDSNAQAAANKEFSALGQELTRLSKTTSFGGQQILDGTYNGQFQIGANNTTNDRVNIDLSSASTLFTGVTPKVAGVNSSLTVTATGAAAYTIAANKTVTIADGSGAGDVVVTLGAAGTNSASTLAGALNGNNAFSARYNASVVSNQLVVTSKAQSGTESAIALTTNDTGSSIALTGTATPGTTAVKPIGISGFDTVGLQLNSVSVDTAANAQLAIDAVTNALSGISTARATIGAVQNRFEKSIDNLNTAIQNITASNSAIRDTDMAAEMTKFTKNQVLSQAGTSMLAQANSSTQNILTLLRG